VFAAIAAAVDPDALARGSGERLNDGGRDRLLPHTLCHRLGAVGVGPGLIAVALQAGDVLLQHGTSTPASMTGTRAGQSSTMRQVSTSCLTGRSRHGQGPGTTQKSAGNSPNVARLRKGERRRDVHPQQGAVAGRQIFCEGLGRGEPNLRLVGCDAVLAPTGWALSKPTSRSPSGPSSVRICLHTRMRRRGGRSRLASGQDADEDNAPADRQCQ
jgi:hypothetical protein